MFHRDQRLAQFLGQFWFADQFDFVLPRDLRIGESLQKIVDIVAAEVRIAVGGEYLVDIAFTGGNQFEDGDVEGAATEIVDGHASALFFVQAVGERRCGGLIHQAQNVEARNSSRVLGRLALRVVEIRGDGDDRAIDGFTEVRFGPIFELAENKRRDFRWREEFVAELDANDVPAGGIDAEREQPQFVLNVSDTATHQALYRIDAAFRLFEQATASGFADDDATVRIDADHRGAQRAAAWTDDTLRRIGLRIGVRDQTVGSAEIDSYYASHVRSCASCKRPQA